MSKIKGTKHILSMSLDAELVKRVENLADAKGKSRSAMIEELLSSAIAQEEVAVRIMTNPTLRDAALKLFGRPDVLNALLKGGDKAVSAEQFHQSLGMLSDVGVGYEQTNEPQEAAEIARRSIKRRAGRKKRGSV